MRCPLCSKKVVLFEAVTLWECAFGKPFRGKALLKAICPECGGEFETAPEQWRTGAALS